MMSVIDQEERGVSISVYGMADERGHGAFFDASLEISSAQYPYVVLADATVTTWWLHRFEYFEKKGKAVARHAATG